jgi:hypothetical protein
MKLFRTIIISLLISATIAIPFTTASLITTDAEDANSDNQYQIFSDIDSDHWAFPYLRENSAYSFLESGAVDTNAEEFRCNDSANRAEAAKMFSLAYDIYSEVDTPSIDFSDVNQENWFYNYVHSLTEIGVIEGYEDETFKPSENINRAEVAQIAYSLILSTFPEDKEYDESLADDLQTFTDVESNNWFYTPIEMLAQSSILSGYEDGSFQPEKEVTRCELAKIISVSSLIAEANNGLTEISDSFTEEIINYLAETYNNMSDEELIAELENADEETVNSLIAMLTEYNYEDLASRIESLQ